MCCLLRYVDTKTMESVNDRDTMEDMITFGQWSLQLCSPGPRSARIDGVVYVNMI